MSYASILMFKRTLLILVISSAGTAVKLRYPHIFSA